jgi:peptidoglycan hydrolase-like protein with peptidoglycan-binding domain
MADLSYKQPGLILERGGTAATRSQVSDLQRDLRALGYLRDVIDGVYGAGTEQAVKALQRDLLSNDGSSSGGDGPAPVRVLDYNRGRVRAVSGAVDQALVACLADILDDTNFPRLPSVPDPVEQNNRIIAQIAALPSPRVPPPFLMAILTQESGLRHFHEPGAGDADTFIVAGLDFNDPARPERITSRGYGVGQYTLFHHPARPDEVGTIMRDVAKNLQMAIGELRGKFDHFVNGSELATRADDRIAEDGAGPLRLCKYASDDPRFMRDCRRCALAAGGQDIRSGVTPLYEGASETFQPTQYYADTSYHGVPVRKNIGCDWPYAARRYNGSGMNSYHYQVRVLKNLLADVGGSR